MDDPEVRLVEIDVSRAAYDEGHIPGAVLWNAYTDLRDESYSPVGLAELERLLSRSGISPETCVVVYGYGAALGTLSLTRRRFSWRCAPRPNTAASASAPSGATADAGRAGHVPGAVSVPIDLLHTESGTLKDPEELGCR